MSILENIIAKQKFWSYLALLIFVFYTFIYFVIRTFQMPLADFAVYCEAGARMFSGELIYGHRFNIDIQQRMFPAAVVEPERFWMWYFYPPFLAFWIYPLSKLDYQSAKFAWQVFNFLAFLVGVYGLSLSFAGKNVSLRGANFEISKPLAFLIVLVAASIFDPFALSFSDGQVDVLVFALISWYFLLYKRGKFALSGALIGVACLLKVVPGILLIWPLIKKNWSVLFAAMGVGALALLILLLAPIPFAIYSDFFFKLPVIASGSVEQELIMNMALGPALSRIFTNVPISICVGFVKATLLLFMFWCVLKIYRSDDSQYLRLSSVLVLLMILFSPTLFGHHLVWAFIVIVYYACSIEGRSEDRVKSWVRLLIVYCLLAKSYLLQASSLLYAEQLSGLTALVPNIALLALIYLILSKLLDRD